MSRLRISKSKICFGLFLIAILGVSASIAQATPGDPVPFIGALSPTSVIPGGADFTLTVNGVNFVAASVVNWGNTPLTTTYISSTQLTAIVPAALTASSGTGWITVSSVVPCESTVTSNTAFLPVGAKTSLLNFSSSQLSTGSEPFILAEGDFKSNGNLDFVVANWSSNTLSIFISNGDGTFQVAQTISTSARPFSVTVGDFNNDGKPDLAVGFESSVGISIFLGNGDGTFQAPVSSAAGSDTYGSVAGDFNKDGNLDLAVANYSQGEISVLLGKGDGTFQSPVTYNVNSNPIYIHEADLNGDGNLDLVVGDFDGTTISVLLGVGDGTFQLQRNYPVGIEGSDIAIGDFNGDGKLDLIATSQADNNIYFLAGVGDGTFLSAQAIPVGIASSVAGVGDFNDDGKLDLALASNSGNIGIALGNGDGTFQPAQQQVFANSFSPFGLAVGNFNTGGGLGVAVAFNSGQLEILIQTLSVSPASFNFGNQNVGTASVVKDFTITNSTSQLVTFTSIGFTGTNSADFSDTTDCAATLASGAVCTVHVTFTPGAMGARSATLSIADNAPGNPQTVGLTGTGVAAPIVSLSATTINFPDQAVGTAGAPQSVTLSNTGNADLNISSIAVTGSNPGDFTLTPAGSCGETLAAEGTCTINVTFTPSASGARSAAVTLTDNAADSPETITLSGHGLLQPTANLSVTSLTYTAAAVGSTSAPQMVTLTNNGGVALAITSIVTAGANSGDFAVSNTCPFSLAAGAHCSISATFTPTAGGARAATIQISDNAASSPQVIILQGSGQDFSLSLSPVAPIAPGTSGILQLTVTSLGGYNQSISFACSGAPSLSTCTVSPDSITPTGSTTNLEVVLATTGSAVTAPPRNPSAFPPAARRLFVPIALIATLMLMALGFLAPGVRKLRPADLALAVVLLLCSVGLAACGSSVASTPPGTYALTVTATSGSLVHSANVQITIQ